MTVGFRLDSNEYVASGHMFRCVTIANALRKKNVKVIFLLAEEKNTELLLKNKFKYIVFHGHWNDYDQDIDAIQNVIGNEEIDILVVDSYKATKTFLEQINRKTPVFLLDDMCKEQYNVNTVLHISEWEGNTPLKELYKDSCVKTISGLKYVPLREEFTEDKMCDPQKQILITTGGTDAYHVSYRVAQLLLNESKLNEFSILVVCGSDNQDYDKLCDLRKKEARLNVIRNAWNMAELMRQSTFAVSAGGMTIYELSAVHCPTVALAISDDQLRFLTEMQKLGIVLYAGDIRQNKEDTYGRLMQCVIRLLDKTEIETMQSHMQCLVDGKGADRISCEILRCK